MDTRPEFARIPARSRRIDGRGILHKLLQVSFGFIVAVLFVLGGDRGVQEGLSVTHLKVLVPSR